jgi:hypothetical protein
MKQELKLKLAADISGLFTWYDCMVPALNLISSDITKQVTR